MTSKALSLYYKKGKYKITLFVIQMANTPGPCLEYGSYQIQKIDNKIQLAEIVKNLFSLEDGWSLNVLPDKATYKSAIGTVLKQKINYSYAYLLLSQLGHEYILTPHDRAKDGKGYEETTSAEKRVNSIASLIDLTWEHINKNKDY